LKLTSINVSQPVEAKYRNKIVSTGIFKKPIKGDVIVQSQGLIGDQQVDLKNHGGEHKAVYAFSEHHYDYWRKVLSQPALSFGQFGENLTISDLDEATLCIGDQIQIGDCILEITQPRVPCFKLAMALKRDEMPKLFVQYGATGIYFRVLQSASIKAGDNVEVIHHHPKQLTVQTLFKAYFDKSFSNPQAVMALATEIPQLSAEWRKKVLSRI
jgi:MOSC domain-containing protein YiiM